MLLLLELLLELLLQLSELLLQLTQLQALFTARCAHARSARWSGRRTGSRAAVWLCVSHGLRVCRYEPRHLRAGRLWGTSSHPARAPVR